MTGRLSQSLHLLLCLFQVLEQVAIDLILWTFGLDSINPQSQFFAQQIQGLQLRPQTILGFTGGDRAAVSQRRHSLLALDALERQEGFRWSTFFERDKAFLIYAVV